MTRRFPRSVYSVGAEPDVRFTLANERTFLAWIRTALALDAAGVALQAFELPVDTRAAAVASILFVALGTLTPAHAWIGWSRTERAMRLRQPLPAPALVSWLGLGTLAGGLSVLVGLVVG